MPITMGELQDVYIDRGNCAICGKPTYRLGLESSDLSRADKEPLVCTKCLIDLRGDMATELEVRRQLSNLETEIGSVSSKVNDRLDTRLWVLGILLAVALTVGGFFAGAYIG